MSELQSQLVRVLTLVVPDQRELGVNPAEAVFLLLKVVSNHQEELFDLAVVDRLVTTRSAEAQLVLVSLELDLSGEVLERSHIDFVGDDSLQVLHIDLLVQDDIELSLVGFAVESLGNRLLVGLIVKTLSHLFKHPLDLLLEASDVPTGLAAQSKLLDFMLSLIDLFPKAGNFFVVNFHIAATSETVRGHIMF